MRLRALRLRHIRQFGARGAALEDIADGINVLAAANEAGKTTLFDALRAALFIKPGSTSREAASLSGDGGGVREVELDVDTSDGAFRLNKRFKSKQSVRLEDRMSGRLLAEGEAVDDWISATLGLDRADAGPAGLLWLQQGLGLDQVTNLAAAPASVRSVVALEVGEITGGARTRHVLDRANEARAKLVTERGRKPKTGGDFDRATRRLAELSQDVETLTSRAAAADAALEKLAHIENALAEAAANDTGAEIEAKLQHAQAGLEALRAAAARKDALMQACAHARQSEAAASDAATRLAAAHTAAQTLLARLAQLQAEFEAAQAEHTREQAAEASARAARDNATEALRSAQTASERARRGAAARAAKAELESARATLDEAQTTATRLRERRAERAANKLTPERLESLEVAAGRAQTATAQLAARRPSLRISYDEASAARVRLEGAPLAGDIDHPIDSWTALELDGIGRLAIDPGGSDAELESAARAADDVLAAQLQELGVADLAAARRQLRQAETIELDIEGLLAEGRRLAPKGLDALAAHVAALTTASADEVEDAPDLEATLEAEAEANAAAATAQQTLNEQIEAASPRREWIARLRAEVALLEERQREDVERLGPQAVWPERAAAAEAARADARAATAVAEAELARTAAEPIDVDAAKAVVERLEQAQRNHRERLQSLRLERAQLTGELNAAGAEGIGERLAEAQAQLEVTSRQVDAFAHEADALDRLIAAVEASEARARDRFAAPVLAVMEPLVRHILPDARLALDEAFAPERLQRGERDENVKRLSGGTREQLAILARLAFARVLARQGRELPVILDDALVFSDDDRIERMFDALAQAGRDVQVLVLTCRERSFRAAGGQMLRIEPWPERTPGA